MQLRGKQSKKRLHFGDNLIGKGLIRKIGLMYHIIAWLDYEAFVVFLGK
jgi:hypothetical protein